MMSKEQQIQSDGSAVMARLATRVRAARSALGLSRRALSERSGVSPRYLAQIEAGEGNISVVLLDRVATALDVRIEDLVKASETAILTATPVQPGNAPTPLRARRICLVGLRGAGKTTLGKLAAAKLNIPFVALADQIQAMTGMPPSEVIALYGEDGYRAAEAQALDAVITAHHKMILAVPGGIVSSQAAYTRVLERFHTIWLRASPAEHMARVRAQGEVARIERAPVALDQVKALLAERTPGYAQAQAQVDTTGKPVPASVNDLLALIASRQFLNAQGRG